MSDYSTELEGLFRKAPQATGMLEAINFEFQGAGLRYCKANQEKELRLTVGGIDLTFPAASFEVDQLQISEQQKQVLTVTFPSAGTELYAAMDFFARNRTFFKIKMTYLQYYIDDFTVNPDPGLIVDDLYVFSIGVNSKADVQIQASTDNLNTYTVGDLYTYDNFPALRSQ